jgi:hypothetical protein
MAVTMVGNNGLKKDFQGLSTDIKPVDDKIYRVGYGSTFYEIDTKKAYLYDTNINPLTTDNWWEV